MKVFDICVLDMLGNTHIAYDFDESGKILVIFYQGSITARFNSEGVCLSNDGFSEEMLSRFSYIVNINIRRIEDFVDNGDSIIYL